MSKQLMTSSIKSCRQYCNDHEMKEVTSRGEVLEMVQVSSGLNSTCSEHEFFEFFWNFPVVVTY